ncbi:hypothetical protein [Brevundimonas denitrificans]|nr:hypothetical protein [Brevundimonas denitrificans]
MTWALTPSQGGWTLTLDGDAAPPAGFVLSWPSDAPAPGRTVIDSEPVTWDGLNLTIPANARRVEILR